MIPIPTTTLDVRVGRRHIEAGEPRWREKCPVALRLKELLKPGIVVLVTAAKIQVGRRGKWERFDPSPAVSDWIKRFDNAAFPQSAKPLRFRVRLPVSWLRKPTRPRKEAA